jgi:hypothetical protein
MPLVAEGLINRHVSRHRRRQPRAKHGLAGKQDQEARSTLVFTSRGRRAGMQRHRPRRKF